MTRKEKVELLKKLKARKITFEELKEKLAPTDLSNLPCWMNSRVNDKEIFIEKHSGEQLSREEFEQRFQGKEHQFITFK